MLLSSQIIRDQDSIGTRSSVLAVVVPYVHGPGTSTIAFTAAWKVWNALRLNIHSIQSPRSFRKAVRDVFCHPIFYMPTHSSIVNFVQWQWCYLSRCPFWFNIRVSVCVN